MTDDAEGRILPVDFSSLPVESENSAHAAERLFGYSTGDCILLLFDVRPSRRNLGHPGARRRDQWRQ